MATDELPLYASFEEEISRCVLCEQNSDEPINYGEKWCAGDITAHFYCMLLSSKLVQNGDDDEELKGFLIADIKQELKRSAKLTCVYCKKHGASIGCCRKQCRKSFHLHCALKNNCTFEFDGTYRSFCNLHYAESTLNTSGTHEKDEKCAICTLEMGKFHPSTSMQFSCCQNGSWYHKSCLRKMAFEQKDLFQCPSCDDYETFRENMLQNGIFIPTSSAENETNNNKTIHNANEPVAKRRRIHKDWLLIKTFISKCEAEAAVVDEKVWSHHYSKNADSGLRVTYRCNLVKLRGKQCAASAYLQFDSRSDNISWFHSDNDHTHALIETTVFKFSPQQEEAIRDMVENNLPPKTIKYNLIKKGLGAPPASKLTSFLTKLRKEKYGKDKINVGTLEKWIQENLSMPEGETTPFVLNYEIDTADENDVKFRFLVTSKLLLKAAIGVEKIHTDATYKLIWQRYPVLLIGTTDLYRKFHVFGIAVCTNETETDFAFIFDSLKNGLADKFNTEMNPKYLIADAGKSIHNAFRRVFGEDNIIIMCYFHMKKAVKSNLPQFISDENKQNSFLADLDKLQLSKSSEKFDRAAGLFVEKWERESRECMQYFRREWLDANRYWYEGCAKFVPSTNNAQESFHRTIKDEQTFRERLELSRFRIKLFDMVKQWSVEYDEGLNVINNIEPNIDLGLWTLAYNWAKSNVIPSIKRQKNYVCYRIPLDPAIAIGETNWQTFDEFRQKEFSYCEAVFPNRSNAENWLKADCDCKMFFKKYICEHIIGIALRMKWTTAPIEAKNIPLGAKRKRGRPAKAKAALIREE